MVSSNVVQILNTCVSIGVCLHALYSYKHYTISDNIPVGCVSVAFVVTLTDTVHSTQGTLYTAYRVHCTQHTQGTLYTAHRVHCTQHTGYTVYSTQGTLYTAHRVYCTQHTGYTVHSTQGTLCTTHRVHLT